MPPNNNIIGYMVFPPARLDSQYGCLVRPPQFGWYHENAEPIHEIQVEGQYVPPRIPNVKTWPPTRRDDSMHEAFYQLTSTLDNLPPGPEAENRPVQCRVVQPIAEGSDALLAPRVMIMPPPMDPKQRSYSFRECNQYVKEKVQWATFYDGNSHSDDCSELVHETRAYGRLIASFKCSFPPCLATWGGIPVTSRITKYKDPAAMEPTAFVYDIHVHVRQCVNCGAPAFMRLDLASYIERVSERLILWQERAMAAQMKTIQPSGPLAPNDLDSAISDLNNAIHNLALRVQPQPPPATIATTKGSGPSAVATLPMFVTSIPPRTNYIFPELHSGISTLVPGINFSSSNNAGIEEVEKNLVGSFTCSNQLCGHEWSSGIVATVIRKYNKKVAKKKKKSKKKKQNQDNKNNFEYNALVYNQRCNRCDSLGVMSLDQHTYIQRVSRQLMRWNGIAVPLVPNHGHTTRPHDWERCEGCKVGRCQRTMPAYDN